MRTSARSELPQWMLIAAMWLLSAVAWTAVPDRVPVHWGVSGEVDRYGGRAEGLLLLPLIAVGVYLLLRLVPRLDPARANYAHFAGAYGVIRLAVIGLFAAIHGFVLLSARGVATDAAVVGPVAVGGLFVAIGNVMGKLRPNHFVGIRTPWTLASKRSWTKTHRRGGWLFVLAGLASIGAGLGGAAWALAVPIVLVPACVVYLSAYSYLLWKADPDPVPVGQTFPVESEG